MEKNKEEPEDKQKEKRSIAVEHMDSSGAHGQHWRTAVESAACRATTEATTPEVTLM
jgi:hypothetical protein